MGKIFYHYLPTVASGDHQLFVTEARAAMAADTEPPKPSDYIALLLAEAQAIIQDTDVLRVRILDALQSMKTRGKWVSCLER